jgi:RNA polymerase sigma-70 factor, ECF subfamily
VGGDVDEPDPQVLNSARRGDQRAFGELVRAYQGDVWRLCMHLTGDRALADDITQDAFVRAFRFLPRFRGEAKFSTWMFTIARNCALDEMRRSKRRQLLAEKAHMYAQVQTAEQSSGLEVRDALKSLPIELREPVALIDMLGESYRDAAKILGVPEGTVKSRVHRARLQLAAILIDEKAVTDEI